MPPASPRDTHHNTENGGSEEIQTLYEQGHQRTLQLTLHGESARDEDAYLDYASEEPNDELVQLVRSLSSYRRQFQRRTIEVWEAESTEDGDCERCLAQGIECVVGTRSDKSVRCEGCHTSACSRVKMFREWLLTRVLGVSRDRAAQLMGWVSVLHTHTLFSW